VAEFRWGGEYRVRPSGPVSDREWSAHLYERRNPDGPLVEWWFHRFGCRCWFLATRDTRDNRVAATGWPEAADRLTEATGGG
jgi:sarcosine oxidase subunit delta